MLYFQEKICFIFVLCGFEVTTNLKMAEVDFEFMKKLCDDESPTEEEFEIFMQKLLKLITNHENRYLKCLRIYLLEKEAMMYDPKNMVDYLIGKGFKRVKALVKKDYIIIPNTWAPEGRKLITVNRMDDSRRFINFDASKMRKRKRVTVLEEIDNSEEE